MESGKDTEKGVVSLAVKGIIDQQTLKLVKVRLKFANICYVAFCLSILISCQKSTHSDLQADIVVHLDNKEISTLSPDTIYSSVNYIPLETTEEAIFYDIDKILFYNDSYYILDQKQAIILCFNENGKYLSKLSKQGQGKGEYLSLDDFFISDSLLYVLSSSIQKILVYDKQFNFLKDFPIGTYATNMMLLDNNIYVYTNFGSSDLKNIYIVDKITGKKKNKHGKYLKKQSGVAYSTSAFAEWNDSLYVFFPYDYTIYTLSPNGYDSYLRIDFGKKNMFPDSFTKLSDSERTEYIKQHYSDFWELPISRINNLYMSDKLLFFTFIYHHSEYKMFLDRESNNYMFGYILSTEKFPFADSNFLSLQDNKVITYVLPETIQSTIELNERTKNKLDISYEFFEQLDVTDNPVLCIYTLKNQ